MALNLLVLAPEFYKLLRLRQLVDHLLDSKELGRPRKLIRNQLAVHSNSYFGNDVHLDHEFFAINLLLYLSITLQTLLIVV